jgi:hypothetical protein
MKKAIVVSNEYKYVARRQVVAGVIAAALAVPVAYGVFVVIDRLLKL